MSDENGHKTWKDVLYALVTHEKFSRNLILFLLAVLLLVAIVGGWLNWAEVVKGVTDVIHAIRGTG